jgi:hypothetical protein
MKAALLVGGILCIAGSACRNSTGPADHLVVLNVDKVNAPATISSTSPIDVVLNVMTSPCQSFARIGVARSSASVKLTVLGKDPEKGCIDLGVLQQRGYRIEPPFAPGVFTITIDRGTQPPLVAKVQVQ